MTKNTRPIPEVNPETRKFWNAASDHVLLLRKCKDCGLVFFYPRSLCPDCFSEEVVWTESEGVGEIYSHSVTNQIENWPVENYPLIIAFVELVEGPRILTNIVESPKEEIKIGATVEVKFINAENEDISLPVFKIP